MRLARLTLTDPHLRPWFGPVNHRARHDTLDVVNARDIKVGQYLIVRADEGSPTAWTPVHRHPFELCKVVNVPPELLDDYENVRFTVEYFMADKCAHPASSGTHTRTHPSPCILLSSLLCSVILFLARAAAPP